MENKQKDKWDKLQAIGGIISPLVIVLIGYFINDTLKTNEEINSNNRLYTDLMARREEAESNIRKDMFVNIMNSLLKKETKKDLSEDLANLELLAFNFHEEIHLKPLFLHVMMKVMNSDNDEITKNKYKKRIESAANYVKSKQRQVLEAHGVKKDITVNLDSVKKIYEVTLELNKIKRSISLSVSKVGSAGDELGIILFIKKYNSVDSDSAFGDIKPVQFRLDKYNFPMIDNTFLSEDQRCAVVLNHINKSRAQLEIILFPGKYASLKDRSDILDLIDRMKKEE